MIYPKGTVGSLVNKDGTMDEAYVGREITVLSAPEMFRGNNRHGNLCEYEGYACEVEGEKVVMFAKHVWIVPKRFPKDNAFEKFKIEMLKPVDQKILEEA